MAKLLCVSPWPGLKTHYGRLPGSLIRLWEPHFEEIAVWSTYGQPEEGETPDFRYWAGDRPLIERLPELGEIISQQQFTHIWILGDLQFLSDIAGLGLVQDRLPDQLLYAYAVVDTPFIDQKYAPLAQYFDFLVFLSGMALGAYNELVAGMGSQVPKSLFKSTLQCKAIRPGVDNQVFRPTNVQRKEFGAEELRETFFGQQLKPDDLLVMVSGQKSKRKGLPQACSVIRHLQPLLKNRRAKLYCHMPPSTKQPNIRLLAEGHDLEPGDLLMADHLFDGEQRKLADEELNLLYNATDLVLCPDLAGGWSFTASEAMAAGAVVAAPDEHVWLDLVAGKGIELPATEFGWAPWSKDAYVRSIDPGISAQKIADVVNDLNKYHSLRESGIYWAVADQTSTWQYAADQWLGLFGLA